MFTIWTRKNNEIESAFDTFYKNLKDFLKFIYLYCIEEKFIAEKLQDKTDFMINILNLIGNMYKIENNIENIKHIAADKKIKRISKHIEILTF